MGYVADDTERLTKRVAKLWALGLAPREIADALGIPAKSVYARACRLGLSARTPAPAPAPDTADAT